MINYDKRIMPTKDGKNLVDFYEILSSNLKNINKQQHFSNPILSNDTNDCHDNL